MISQPTQLQVFNETGTTIADFPPELLSCGKVVPLGEISCSLAPGRYPFIFHIGPNKERLPSTGLIIIQNNEGQTPRQVAVRFGPDADDYIGGYLTCDDLGNLTVGDTEGSFIYHFTPVGYDLRPLRGLFEGSLIRSQETGVLLIQD